MLSETSGKEFNIFFYDPVRRGQAGIHEKYDRDRDPTAGYRPPLFFVILLGSVRHSSSNPVCELNDDRPKSSLCEESCVPAFFFWERREIRRITPSAIGGAEGSVRLLLTENPARSFSCCPRCQVHGISCERFPRPWQTVGPVSGPFSLC